MRGKHYDPFREVFMESLADVKDSITGKQPELIFLIGGVSKMPAVRKWCSEVFTDSVIISATDPEFSVARGLAYCGRIDEDLREFKEDLDKLVHSNTIEDIVGKHITKLYKDAVDTLVDPIVKQVALPIFEKWRSGEISKLSDTDVILQQDIAAFLSEDATRELLAGPITSWLRPVIEELEEHTVPICIRHRVPYTALSLKSYLSVSDIDIKVNAKEMFAINDIKAQIICASVRNPIHVMQCALAGADIATVPYSVIATMIKHPLTTQGIEKFQADYKKVFG